MLIDDFINFFFRRSFTKFNHHLLKPRSVMQSIILFIVFISLMEHEGISKVKFASLRV